MTPEQTVNLLGYIITGILSSGVTLVISWKLATLQYRQGELAIKQGEAALKQSEGDRLLAEIARLTGKITAVEQKNEQLEESVRVLQRELDIKNDQIFTLTDELKQANARTHELEVTNAELIAARDREREALTGRVARLEQMLAANGHTAPSPTPHQKRPRKGVGL